MRENKIQPAPLAANENVFYIQNCPIVIIRTSPFCFYGARFFIFPFVTSLLPDRFHFVHFTPPQSRLHENLVPPETRPNESFFRKLVRWSLEGPVKRVYVATLHENRTTGTKKNR